MFGRTQIMARGWLRLVRDALVLSSHAYVPYADVILRSPAPASIMPRKPKAAREGRLEESNRGCEQRESTRKRCPGALSFDLATGGVTDGRQLGRLPV